MREVCGRALRAASIFALALGLLLPDQSRAAEDDAAQGLWQRQTLTGDWGGARTKLDDAGISFTSTYIGEALGNLSGGISRTSIYEGRLELTTELDLAKLMGWSGGTLHATAYQIHGRGLTSRTLDNLLDVSSIEARPTTRLFTLWLQQQLWSDTSSIRVGQIAADDEFIISDTAAIFVNATFGWPGWAAADLPSGGPAYPLATPGARLRFDPAENVTLLGAVFSGNPAGNGGPADPQLRDISGTTFSFSGGTLMIGEAQYRINQGEHAAGLPGTYKFGLWYHTGSFADLNLDRSGRSLASPASSGVPLRHRSDYAIYAIADQTVWQGADQGLNLFLRIAGAPSDRNLISFYVDGGAAFSGLIAGRPDDKLGLAVGYARIGDAARDFDSNVAAFTGSGLVRDYETVLELTYQAQIAPWWILQPDLQVVFHPGGTVANPSSATPKPIGDAVVLGLRTVIKL